MEVTLLGIVIEVKPVQPLNVHLQIDVIPFGIVTSFKLVHS